MRRASRWELARALAERYVRADKGERGRILDTFCEATGYARKYAIGLLRRPPPEAPSHRRRRARVYGPAEVELLRACWELTDQICGKRLAPFLPELLERRAARRSLPASATVAVVERVGRMSPATVDRVLRPYRLGLPRHRPSTTAPGALLKGQVPLRTFADWDQTGPGFFEMDLVAHCGWSAAGEFLYTLCLVDVASGWVICAGLRNKRDDTVLAALDRLRAGLPCPMLGLDSDNGSEFINRTLITYCADTGVTFTRGRPFNKNDGCHVEQMNWAVVRRLVGYARLEPLALAALERLHALARDYVNFLHPVRKLTSRTRVGARLVRRYDRAQTPYRRLLASNILSETRVDELAARYLELDPVRLKRDIESAQRTLRLRAAALGGKAHWAPPSPRRSDPYVRHHGRAAGKSAVTVLVAVTSRGLRGRSPSTDAAEFVVQEGDGAAFLYGADWRGFRPLRIGIRRLASPRLGTAPLSPPDQHQT